MTVFRLGLPGVFTTPRDAAEYYRIGGEYVVDVARDMDWDHGGFEDVVARGYEAMRDGDRDVDDRVARSIAAVLAGDADFYTAFIDWFPPYRVFARPLDWLFGRKLRRLAAGYVDADAGVAAWLRNYPGLLDEPSRYSRPGDLDVDGRPPTAYAESFGDRVVLADAVLHAEWFADVAGAVEVACDDDLVDRTVALSPAFFAGRTDDLPEDVARFQRALFRDADWLRDVDRLYGLDSVICREAAEDLDAARARLPPSPRTP